MHALPYPIAGIYNTVEFTGSDFRTGLKWQHCQLALVANEQHVALRLYTRLSARLRVSVSQAT